MILFYVFYVVFVECVEFNIVLYVVFVEYVESSYGSLGSKENVAAEATIPDTENPGSGGVDNPVALDIV